MLTRRRIGMAESIVITGRAYQRRATLDVNGDTLTWRARRGHLQSIAENIATTTHELRDVTWLEKRWNLGGVVLAALAMFWAINGDAVFGAITFAIAVALVVWRAMRPRYWLGLDVGSRWLVLRVDHGAAAEARTLAARVERRLLTGDAPPPPTALP